MSSFEPLTNNQDPAPEMPWDRHPSIYEHICAHILPDKPGLAEGGYTLPDDQKVNEPNKIRFAPGALEGIMTHHVDVFADDAEDADGESHDESDTHEALIAKTVELVREFSGLPTAANKLACYEHLLDGSVLSMVDSVLEAIANAGDIYHIRLHELAYSFATEASDREPVKFGIAVLMLFVEPENEELFQKLGRHDEFTLYCSVALSNTAESPEQALWQLAQNVDGWGRIQVVEQLAGTEQPEIQDWMLREGYRNSVMYGYLAYTCATTGRLLAALSEESLDPEMLASAGEILVALVEGGPAESIDDYDDGALAVEMYLRHMETMAERLPDFAHVLEIKRFLDDTHGDWDAREQRGWNEARRKELQTVCRQLLARPDLPQKALLGLTSEDHLDFHYANQIAEALGLDTWETHWHRVEQEPKNDARWYHLMTRCNEERIAEVVALAERLIELEKVTTGPAEELGLGPGWEDHSCLEYVLQELGKFPGHGQVLIQTGLRSPVVRNRNMATRAMSEWGRDHWSDELRAALETAARVECSDGVREWMDQTLRGEPLND